MRLRQELTIRRPPECVFRWIEDPDLAMRWQPEVAEYTITRPVPGLVGTEFRETLRDGNSRVQLNGRITGYTPNHLLEVELAGRGIRIRVRYTLNPQPAGTRLRVDTDLHIGGRLSPLAAPLLHKRIASRASTELQRLRQLCEAEPGR